VSRMNETQTPFGPMLTGHLAPPSEEAISAFEAKYSYALPPDYRAFLTKFNGGKPRPSAFLTASDGSPYTDSLVHSLFPLDPKHPNNLEMNVGLMRGRLPAGLLAIGEDPGGNLICIGAQAGPDYGHVFFWDHERELSHRHLAVVKIAESFSTFMASLFDADKA
jgi:hypothetical protein